VTGVQTCALPISPTFTEWLNRAWDWVQAILDQDPERRASFDEITVASMIYCRFCFHMKNGLIGDKRVQLITNGRMTRASIDGELIIRFKKLDRTLRSRNIATGNQERIYNQQYRLEEIGDRPTNVTFGYFTDSLGTKLLGVYFACPKNWSANLWVVRVGGPDESGEFLFDPHGIDRGPAEVAVGRERKASEA